MGFLTRLLAGLTAAAALGAGLSGTANAVDVTGATGNTKSVVKLADDGTSNLPDHLVNGDFEYPVKSDMPVNDGNFWYISQNDGSYFANGTVLGKRYKLPEGFDKAKFAWHSTQTGDTYYPDLERADDVQVDYKADGTNHYSEISAAQSGATIYQDVATVPGVMYKWSLKHASLDSSHLDKMSVIIGEPGKETAQEATRTTANGHGDKLGKVGTVISTKVSNPEMPAGNKFQEGAHTGQWETYTGTYIATGTVTRFAFRSVEGYSAWDGNLLDDISFSKAYKLTYDKNASDATGSVPSDTTANTVKQAKADATGTVKTVTDTKTKTSGTVKTVADTNASLPDHLVNGDFNVNYHDQWKDSFGGWTSIDPNAGKTLHATSLPNGSSWKWTAINGWDKSKFGWTSTQKAGSNVQQKANAVELQYDDSTADNVYAELCAYEAGTAIYQDIRTVPGTLYKVRLKHASLNSTYLDKMQVMIGTPGHEQPVEMTRTTVNGHGDKLNEKSTTIATKVTNSNNRHHADQWETYEGTYLIPDGQTTTRFTFKSIDAKQLDYGNVLDDIVFDKAYRLSYDKNASDATGKVPSNQRGKENTVEPANAKTAGTVRTVADKTASGLTVHDLKNGEIAPVQYGDFKFSTTDGVTADQITDVNGFTVKTNWNPTVENQAYGGRSLDTMYQPNRNGASLVLHHVGQWRDSSGTQRWLNARITVNGQNLGSLVYYESKHEFLASYGKWDRHTSSRPYMDVTVDFLLDDGSTPQGLRGVTGFTDLDGGASGYNEGVELVSGFDGAYVRSDAHLARFGTNGWAGATDENENNADAHGMKHYVGATFTGSSFRVRWSVASGQARGSGFQPVDSTIAYRLTYNKNAQDATGSIPSDTAANTTRPAKSETDGKVSDLVQRTTTHEDGSVTVRTIDTSTDVVSGCQVYYPAGQRITLATMAKDDDCWDSSMLSRPGHTQLGWNQDRNATQAQAEVTMVEGGMTVFAVWVGNPVLTYDTNKPSTWSGQMPSTPASVSVPYNTAAADGSGWQSGDTTKIKGYRFLGWYTTPQDGSNLYDWNTPLTGSVTVYAHWQRLQANVIYNANGGTGSHPNTTGWQYSDVTIPGDTSKSFKRDKYVFKGWGTKPGKADVVYKDGSKVALQDKDITLYAQWQEVHENFVETGGIGLPIAIAGGVLLLMFGIGSTVMLTRRMNGHGMPDDE
ncbi:InlB B-repeat-containing protein [Bifidobacterium adolescentis]|uniref:InlB B-repeat-containing protein n=1 Tax=Bifidobacterium adolescentis TaxID=1680 RepID=UPI000699E9B4|nr:InlB B-repeat-containing protein [Bifidobacterium adolescentis]